MVNVIKLVGDLVFKSRAEINEEFRSERSLYIIRSVLQRLQKENNSYLKNKQSTFVKGKHA